MIKNFQGEIKLFLIVALIAIGVSVGGILLLKTMQPAPVVQTPPPMLSPQPLDTSGWQTYHNDEFGFEVKYPAELLTVKEDGEKTVLEHSVDFEHGNPCDFVGDATPLKRVLDFFLNFELQDKNFAGNSTTG